MEIDLSLHQIPGKQKFGIINTIVSSFIGLVCEGISSFLHNRRNKALHNAVKAMDSKSTNQCNKLIHLKNSILLYDIYNADTLEQLISTVHCIHNITSLHEKLFAGQQNALTLKLLYANALGLQHYSILTALFQNCTRQICFII